MVYLKAVSILCFVGIADCAYLTYRHFLAEKICLAGGMCDVVLTSPFSKVFNIPVCILGLFLYFIILIITLTLKKITWAIALILGLSILGLLLSSYLTYAQFFIIKASCPYCLLSTALIVCIILISIYAMKKEAVQGS